MLLFFAIQIHAESTEPMATAFSVKPKRCVALHQGQTCYQKLSFKFDTPYQDNICLFRSTMVDPLICWRGNDLTKYIYEFRGTQSENFYIANRLTNDILAMQEIRVAWVYKSKKKVPSGWRLF